VDTKPALDALNGCESLEDLGKVWQSLGAMQRQPDVINLKDKLKEELSK